MTRALIPVTAVPSLGPEIGRIDLQVPEGLTVAEIVAHILPAASRETLERARVWLVSNAGQTLLSARRHWHRIRPRAGVRVMIRLVAGDDALKSALLIAVSIAATAIGQTWVAPALSGWATAAGLGAAANLVGQIGAAVLVAGVTLAGGFLINTLFPSQGPASQRSERPLFSISGWQNVSTPDGVVPSILGKVRVAPVFAAPSYTEIVGDIQYIRALFTFGYGPVKLSNLRIKDTPLDSFDEVEYEIREGYDTDEPVTLYPSQVIEDSLGIELRRDRLRDDAGNVIGDGPITPVSRFTAGDATGGNIIFSFPGGLTDFHQHGSDAGEPKLRSVQVRIRQRKDGVGAWTEVATPTFTAKTRVGFFRQYRWNFPERGRWEIEVARITQEATETKISDRTTWLTLQSFRPEYPLNFDKPLNLLSVRIRATYQLNSTLDTLNGDAERLVRDWDYLTETWVLRETRNPAAHFRHILQGPENTYPEPDSAINLAQLQKWHDMCRIKGLKYDRDRNFDASVLEALTEIAAAGRASPRFDGVKWGVVIDRPQELVVAHVNDRNSRAFTWSRTYHEVPHAFRVPFLDQTNDYQERERVVPWPGHVGPVTVYEQLSLPGKTDPDEIWREARRRQYEVIHRPDVFSAVQDGAVRTATRGDLVKGSYSTLSRAMWALKVTAVRGNVVTVDGDVEMDAGNSYAIRFMRQVGEGDDATFVSTVRALQHRDGPSDSVVIVGMGDLPTAGDVVQIGISGEESMDLVVAGTQAGQQNTSVLSMLAAAPIIDELTDAEVPPPWNGRAGSDIGADTAVPAIPVVVSIDPHFDEADDPDGLTVLMEPGPGSAAVVATFTLRHRLVGAGVWNETTVDAADGAATASGYASGANIEMQRRATSISGISSDWSTTFTAEGATTPPLDPPAPPTAGSVTPGAGQADFTVTTPNDVLVAAVGLYYGPNSDGTGVTEIITFAAAPNTAYSRPAETVPAGTWYFFAVCLNSEATPSNLFHLGQAIVT